MYSTARERSLQLNTYWGWGALSASARRTTSAALALHNKRGQSQMGTAHLLHTCCTQNRTPSSCAGHTELRRTRQRETVASARHGSEAARAVPGTRDSPFVFSRLHAKRFT